MSTMISLSLQMPASELPALLALAAKSGVNIEVSNSVAVDATQKKAKKFKKEKDPSAPKKEPNAWIKFCQHIRNTLVAAGEKPGFEAQQFCSHLKASMPLLPPNEKGKQEPDYSNVTEESILTAFKAWTPPEQSKAAAERSSKANSVASAEGSPVAAMPEAPTQKKPRKPQSEETKKAAAAKRAATKAAKAAAAAAGGAKTEAVVPSKPKGPKPSAKVAPAPEPEETETDYDPTDFYAVIIKGKPCLRNYRGDLMTEEGVWMGRYNEVTKLIEKIAMPDDLNDE
jgi:hypothetical protein